MISPLALLLYERLLPGSALGNKLRDQGYRILHVTDPASITATAEKEKPLVAFVDLEWKAADACTAIAALKANSTTNHIPVLADRKSTRLNSSHSQQSRMPSSA